MWLNCAYNHPQKCQLATAAMVAFYSLGDIAPDWNLSAHLAVSRVQDPLILKFKQLPSMYLFIPQIFTECIRQALRGAVLRMGKGSPVSVPMLW